MLKEYIRDNYKRPYGCMVATSVYLNSNVEVINIGVSVCNIQDTNNWNNKVATEIAYFRASTPSHGVKLATYRLVNNGNLSFYHSTKNQVERFVQRCRAYYKDKLILAPNIEWY